MKERVDGRRFMIVLSLAVVAVTAACSTGTPASVEAPQSMPAPTAVSHTAATVRVLDPVEFAAAIAGDRVTINVHVPDQGSLPGTDLAVPFEQITARAAELPQDRSTPLAIYCRSGSMSAIAGPELTALGYTDIVELRGGMEAWQVAGRPLLPAGS